jgi:hypothetical protein
LSPPHAWPSTYRPQPLAHALGNSALCSSDHQGSTAIARSGPTRPVGQRGRSPATPAPPVVRSEPSSGVRPSSHADRPPAGPGAIRLDPANTQRVETSRSQQDFGTKRADRLRLAALPKHPQRPDMGMFRRLAIRLAEPFRHVGTAPDVSLQRYLNAGACAQDLGQTIASRRAFAATAGSSAP